VPRAEINVGHRGHREVRGRHKERYVFVSSVACHAVCFFALIASSALAASPYGFTGHSWDDPPLAEILQTVDVVCEVRCLVGGQWRGEVEPVRVFRGRPSRVLTVEGINSHEWNTAYHALRADEREVLCLYRAAGDLYSLPTPSSGRFPVSHGKVLVRFGEGGFLVEVPADEFRAGLEAYFLSDSKLEGPRRAAEALKALLSTGGLEARYLAIELLGDLPPGAGEEATRLLAPLSRGPNPALREAAAKALGRVGGPGAAKALAAFVTDGDPVVAKAAALAVCETDAAGAARELAAWLSRVSAEEESGRRSPRKDDLEAQAKVFVFLAEGGWRKGAGPDEVRAVVRELVEMIASGRKSRARLAARVLGHLRAREAAPGLMRLLEAEDEDLRREAASALVAITLEPRAGDAEFVREWWAEHKDEPTGAWVKRALDAAREALAGGTYEGEVRARAIFAAARDPLGAWAARERLAEGGGWPGAPLGEIGGPLVAPFAELRLAAPSPVGRAAATETLAGVAESFPGAARAFRNAFLLASYDTDSDVRTAALAALGRSGDLVDAARLVDEMDRGLDSASRRAAADAVRRLAGRRFGFYLSRGFVLEEERGLERWKLWLGEAENAGARRAGRRPARGHPPTDEPAREARLADPDPDVWLPAARAFLGAGDEPRERIERLSRAPDTRLRAIATSLLGLRAEPGSAPTLLERLSDDEPFVRAQAVRALGVALKGSGKPPEAFLDIGRAALVDEPAGDDEAGPGDEDEDLPPSIADPWSVDVSVRSSVTVLQALALHALGRIGGDEGLEVLAACLRSGRSGLARPAAWALGCFPGEAADELLMEAVRQPDYLVREIAASALALRRPGGAAAALVDALRLADYWQAFALTDALARAARPEDAAVVATLLEPADERAAVAAAYTLARTPGPGASEPLVRALERGGPTVRYYAAKALGETGRLGLLDEEARAAAARGLAARLYDFDPSVASAAAAALEHAGDATAAEALLDYLRAWDPPNYRALGALVRFGGEEGLARALEAAESGTWAAKYFAVHALRYAPTEEALTAVVEKWRDPESPFQEVAERTLAAAGEAAVPRVAALLGGADRDARRRAAVLLGKIGGEGASRALVGALASDDAVLAWLAERALAGGEEEEPALAPDSSPAERRKAHEAWSRRLRAPER
jgi:HEAT repeat protein